MSAAKLLITCLFAHSVHYMAKSMHMPTYGHIILNISFQAHHFPPFWFQAFHKIWGPDCKNLIQLSLKSISGHTDRKHQCFVKLILIIVILQVHFILTHDSMIAAFLLSE